MHLFGGHLVGTWCFMDSNVNCTMIFLKNMQYISDKCFIGGISISVSINILYIYNILHRYRTV